MQCMEWGWGRRTGKMCMKCTVQVCLSDKISCIICLFLPALRVGSDNSALFVCFCGTFHYLYALSAMGMHMHNGTTPYLSLPELISIFHN